MTIDVSVLMLTYNHEAYIKQSIESVLSQKTSYTFELIVGEDASTDRTREIVKKLESENPTVMRCTYWDRNVGMHENFFRNLEKCRGRYIAYIEGDDYWTDLSKLQKQVEFLESHPDHVLVSHQVTVLDVEANKTTIRPFRAPRNSYTTKDLLKNNFIFTCSALYRANLIKSYPPWLYKMGMCDWSLHLLHSQFGDIALLPSPMAVYRLHSSGVWGKKKLSFRLLEVLKMYNYLLGELDGRFAKQIRRHIVLRTFFLALAQLKEGSVKCSFRSLIETGRALKRALRSQEDGIS